MALSDDAVAALAAARGPTVRADAAGARRGRMEGVIRRLLDRLLGPRCPRCREHVFPGDGDLHDAWCS